MDGVIANTATYHFKAWHEIFLKQGVNFTEDDFKRHFGQRNDTIIRSTLGESISQGEMDNIADEKEGNYRCLVAPNIKPLPGVIKLIKLLNKNSVKIAVASSAPIENIRLIARGLAIEDYFQAIVWGREVTEGKPSPQVFLMAAQKLRVKPVNCIVIEDAIAGVAGTKRAGMKCLAVTTTHPKEKLNEADLILDTLEKVSLDDLENLFN